MLEMHVYDHIRIPRTIKRTSDLNFSIGIAQLYLIAQALLIWFQSLIPAVRNAPGVGHQSVNKD